MKIRATALCAALASACGDVSSSTPADGAPDVALDAPSDAVADATRDVTADVALDVALDASFDAPSDVPRDVVSDASFDAAIDAAPDALADVTADVTTDAAMDVRVDAVADVVRDAATDARDGAMEAAVDAATDVRVDAVTDVAMDARADVTADAAVDGGVDVPGLDAPDGAWRSVLFPDDWVPVHAGGRADSMGRFLHDFSFAGYHRGERPPYGTGAVVRTVDARFGDGVTDARAAIQADLDAACASTVAGLRVVLLPAGTYLLRFPTASPATDPALRIACSRLVLRGAGAATTRLLLDDPTNARSRSLLRVASRSYSVWAGAASTLLARDVTAPARTVAVESVTGFAPGDLVSVRTDITEGFRADHRMNRTDMGEVFWAASTAQGLLYPRRVVSVDASARTVTLDAPTRYTALRRDNARLYHPAGYLDEVGLEDFAFGMREHATSASGTPGPLGDSADDGYAVAGTAAYEVHGSVGVRIDATRDAWLYRVETFAPTSNASRAHVLSSAMFLTAGTHRVTVEGCRFGRAQYRGGGGNGYLFWVEGDDNLLVDDVASDGRHNFITAHIASSGNVFLRARTNTPRYSDDSHRLLSQANLYDSATLNGGWLQAVNRGATSSGAGFTATQTVFWNTRVVATHASTRLSAQGFASGFAIETSQFGWGYAIGTSGTGSAVATRVLTNSYWATLDPGAPVDFTEGVGRGATLFPQSLFEEQRRRRLLRGE